MRTSCLPKWTLVGLGWLTLLVPKPSGAEEEFRLFTESVEIPERGTVKSYVLIMSGRRFSFLPPAKWSVKSDAAKKTVYLLPEDLRAGISFKIEPEQNGVKPGLNAPRLRQKILERYPGAKITNEFKCYTNGEEGMAFDVERLVEQKTSVSSRIAFVAFNGGTIEFELTANTGKFADCHSSFGALLTSFRIDPVPTK